MSKITPVVTPLPSNEIAEGVRVQDLNGRGIVLRVSGLTPKGNPAAKSRLSGVVVARVDLTAQGPSVFVSLGTELVDETSRSSSAAYVGNWSQDRKDEFTKQFPDAKFHGSTVYPEPLVISGRTYHTEYAYVAFEPGWIVPEGSSYFFPGVVRGEEGRWNVSVSGWTSFTEAAEETFRRVAAAVAEAVLSDEALDEVELRNAFRSVQDAHAAVAGARKALEDAERVAVDARRHLEALRAKTAGALVR